MRIRFSIKRFLVLWIFLFYCSTNSFWGFRLFHESDLFPAIACLIPITLVFFIALREKIRINPGLLILLSLLYSVILISSKMAPKYVLFYGFCISLFFVYRLTDSKDMLKLFYYMGILFAIGSMINYFMPGLYKSVILPAFAGSSQAERLADWTGRVSYRIIPGFANQTSFNAPHFVYGIGYLLGCYSENKKLKFTEWAALALFTVCLILTNKRAHFLFTIATIAVCYYMTAYSGEKSKRALIILIAGVAAILFLYFAIEYLNVGVFIKLRTMLVAVEDDEDITSGRLVLWSIAWKYFLKKPFFGIGWECFRDLPDWPKPVMTHNIYFQLLCETGIFGAGIFFLFFLVALFTALRNCKRAATEKSDMLNYLCLYMQFFFLLYGVTGNPLYDPPYYVPYFMMCAFTFSQSRWQKSVGGRLMTR